MDRLNFIAQINPVWAITICEFFEDYPEFKPYDYMTPIKPIETIPYKNVNTLFQAIMHYICAVGISYNYAIKQWDIIFPLINHDSWDTIFENMLLLKNNTNIQNKKRKIYYNLCQFMNQYNLTHMNLNISHLAILQQKVPGIGIGCVAWCKKYFSLDDDCLEYTDINFVRGFKKLYDSDSLALIKQKANEWNDKKFGRIANLMVLQIGGYT